MNDKELKALLAKAWLEGEQHESNYLFTWGQFCPHGDDCNPYVEKDLS